MTATTLSRSARVASISTLDVYLKPKLAKDAKIDLASILAGKTGKDSAKNKPLIKLGLDKAVAGKLAKDADISDVIEMLDHLDDVVDEGEMTPRGADATGPLSRSALAKDRQSGDCGLCAVQAPILFPSIPEAAGRWRWPDRRRRRGRR